MTQRLKSEFFCIKWFKHTRNRRMIKYNINRGIV